MVRHAIRYAVAATIVCSFHATPPAEAQIGPDVVTSELTTLSQFGREGPVGSGTVGLAMTMTACNLGDEPVEWFGLPDTNHPMLSQNMFRLQLVGGSERLEQIGLAWLKHGFGADQLPGCGIACEAFPDLTQLGVGCSDTYNAGQQASACDLGPRSMLHPYTGVMPGGDDLGLGGGCSQFRLNYPSRNHIGHTHDGISHRLQVRDVDLTPALNPGARYFAEAHYLAPHEFVAGNGNQHNNASYREYGVTGPSPSGLFGFLELGGTVIAEPAVNAWSGTSQSVIEPAPLADGQAHLVYKTTDLGGGLWHYEYAIYNMNLDESVGSLRIPVPSDVILSNIEFHAPLNHAPELHADNYSNDPWVSLVAEEAVTWSTDSVEDRPFANAVRFGTLYNFRFDANTPPKGVDAVVGLFKTGGSLAVSTLGPAPTGTLDCNGNSIDDRCDLDCNAPGCSVLGCGLSSDCTANGIPDECEPDCDNDGMADRCELAMAPGTDCNGNAIPDTCEPGGQADCNDNGRQDICDIAFRTSQDMDNDGQPDECAAQPPIRASAPHDKRTNRFVSIDPNNDLPVTLRVQLLDLSCSSTGKKCSGSADCKACVGGANHGNGCSTSSDCPSGACVLSGESCDQQSPPVLLGWLSDPVEARGDALPGTFTSEVMKAEPVARTWTESVVHIGDCEIAPVRTYAISATAFGVLFSDPLIIGTIGKPQGKFWADIVGGFDGVEWSEPNSLVNGSDVTSMIAFITDKSGKPHITRVDLAGGSPTYTNFIVNATDLQLVIKGFLGDTYPPLAFVVEGYPADGDVTQCP